eukprot:5664770-Amphidinium_carterae.1
MDQSSLDSTPPSDKAPPPDLRYAATYAMHTCMILPMLSTSGLPKLPNTSNTACKRHNAVVDLASISVPMRAAWDCNCCAKQTTVLHATSRPARIPWLHTASNNNASQSGSSSLCRSAHPKVAKTQGVGGVSEHLRLVNGAAVVDLGVRVQSREFELFRLDCFT